jgi:hypothetical protein
VGNKYDPSDPNNDNHMNNAARNLLFSHFARGESIILAQRERLRHKQCTDLLIKVPHEYKQVKHYTKMGPDDGLCSAFYAPYLVRDDSERDTDENLEQNKESGFNPKQYI